MSLVKCAHALYQQTMPGKDCAMSICTYEWNNRQLGRKQERGSNMDLVKVITWMTKRDPRQEYFKQLHYWHSDPLGSK